MDELHWSYSLYSTLVLLADFFIRVGLSTRVIMRKRPYPVSLAWLVVILVIPFLGGITYLLFGENRLPEKRTERAKLSFDIFQYWLKSLRRRAPVIWSPELLDFVPLHRQAETLTGLPAMAGNILTLLAEPDDILDQICSAIENASSSCHLQFYIWESGGRVDRINNALVAAVQRGVTCRILVDSIGSREFLKSVTAKVMRSKGVKIREAMPAGIIKMLFWRIDIRNHRKLVIIDGKIGFTGSQNMVDPDIFKVDVGVGSWVDVMVRIEGPVVESLAGSFIADWFLEAENKSPELSSPEKDIAIIRDRGDVMPSPPVGESVVQLVPSGPGFVPDTIHSLLLTTLYTARREITMTTPYFIPDEPILAALKAASQRGVQVTIIIPRDNDSRLIHYASRARLEELVDCGVKIYLFHGGLLHSKTTTVDGSFALFGSVNLDMRSFWLNFETTLFIYCPRFIDQLLQLQQHYLSMAYPLDSAQFAQRGPFEKFKENTVLLVSPLL